MDLESIYRFKPATKIAEDLERGLKHCGDLESKKIYLRRTKHGEELRIGIRYLIREADLMGTVADLSSLADVYLQSVFQIACEQLRNKSSEGQEAPENFAIIGLGKLGGNELNFGSDLDIIFVYDKTEGEESDSPGGQLVTHYSDLSKMIYQLTSEVTPAGYAYKIDTDLRPEGGSGVLVLSLKGYQDYFQNRSRIWEQQAMTRARFVAGNRQLGEKFLQVAHEVTYGNKLEYGSLIEISRLRARMEKELAQELKKGKNVKLGYGGLADIEFALQILQLMHAGRHPRLQETNSFNLIRLFADHGILDLDVSEQLQEHYLFLRNLECALRLAKATASSHLPKDEESLAVVSRLLGYEKETPAELAKSLNDDYAEVTRKVREFYRQNLDMLLRTSL
jgi:glutamate-ammonia-ligase adenylyltransferase